MFADGGPADNELSGCTTLHPTPRPQQTRKRLKNATNVNGGAETTTCRNSEDNDCLPSPSRRMSAVAHYYTSNDFILSASQCKLRPAGWEFFDPKKQVSVISLQLNDVKMKATADGLKLPQRRCAVKCRTRATQTLFRESSAQTLPYLPGVSNDPKDLETLEIFKLPAILPGDGPPGLYEVEVLERSRRRWAFAKALKENFRKQLEAGKEHAKLQEHKHILEGFEWEHWIEREEHIQECQMLRLELLISMFDKREREMHSASSTRIQKSYKDIEAKRKTALKKNEVEYQRAIRRLETRHANQPRIWRKQHIIEELGNPSSEFYAPKMRHGANPSRRHFKASRKGFDLRMDDLEKRAIKMDPKNLKCPFAKLKKWSTPKQISHEVEQNFCSDANLNKLYESLRTLREASRKPKLTPACLKAKESEKTMTNEAETPNRVSATHMSGNVVVRRKSSIESISSSSTEANRRSSSKTDGSLEEQHQQKQAELVHMEEQQKEKHCEEVETLISFYEGHTIGWLMRFLSEEMCRLKEQRKLQFFAMMAQRTRWHREAAEAGLRQKENYMRDAYENLYKEYDKANQEITDKFLSSILSADIKDYAHQKAKEDVVAFARELDKEIDGWLESFGEVQTPLNYHALRHALKDIVLPDANKIVYRLERDDCINYIITDVLLCQVYHNLESYDVSFGIANDLVDRLIDNDLYLSSPSCSSEYCCCSAAQQEAKAIIRKVIRYAVPGRRWHTDEERIAAEIIADLLNDIFDHVAANNCLIHADMNNPPDIPHQQSHFDLINNEENFLLADPDSLSIDDVFIKNHVYVLPHSRPDICELHSVPSTHDLSIILGSRKPSTLAQAPSEDQLQMLHFEEESSAHAFTPKFLNKGSTEQLQKKEASEEQEEEIIEVEDQELDDKEIQALESGFLETRLAIDKSQYQTVRANKELDVEKTQEEYDSTDDSLKCSISSPNASTENIIDLVKNIENQLDSENY